jgi:FdrA protein
MVAIKNIVKKNLFRDSVQLLHLSEEAKKIKGVLDAAIVMATDLNKELLEKQGLLTEEGRAATENDMVIAVKIESPEILDEVVSKVESLLTAPAAEEKYFYTIDSAIESLKGANLALVSVPGQYAKEVVKPLLEKGLHVHLFSDHVPLEDEIELKKMAQERGLLVMGPGAGTSIINGVAIAFANVVNRGPIGVVAAAGTGLQEFTVLVSEAGTGITHGIGVGGGDVKSPVGGIMTIESIKAFEADPDTEIIAVVSKPPSPDVQDKIVNFIAEHTKKKYVLNFIGGKVFDVPVKAKGRVVQARTVHAAALEAVKLVSEELYKEAARKLFLDPKEVARIAESEFSRLEKGQKFIRGLFTGGTLTYESLVIFKELIGDVYSNAPLDKRLALPDPWKSIEHSVIDLGEEEFTAGRAHPMIDPTIRIQRIIDEAKDPGTAVIMLDFVIGYGSHPDPASAHLNAIKEAKRIAEENGRYLSVLAHVCGTDKDPQNARKQEEILKSAGVIVLPTNALMALAAALIAERKVEEEKIMKFYDEFLKGIYA